MSTLSRDSWDCLEQRPLNEQMASMASSDLSNCFITTAMSFRALSTLSPQFIAFQNNTIAASKSFTTSFIIHIIINYHKIFHQPIINYTHKNLHLTTNPVSNSMWIIMQPLKKKKKLTFITKNCYLWLTKRDKDQTDSCHVYY